jgi:hypothetical protein
MVIACGSGDGIGRRTVLKGLAAGAVLGSLEPFRLVARAAEPGGGSDLFWIRNVPVNPFTKGNNRHAGFAALVSLMAAHGILFYRSAVSGPARGPSGMIGRRDVVLVKVNAQWKYRGATNSDLVRGIIQAILSHPDGFTGEVVIIENGQGRGSLACRTSQAYGGDTSVRANANNERHSFRYLVRTVFGEPRVSAYLLDGIRGRFIGRRDHATQGYRRLGAVSYPCITTRGRGRRVELREGIWRDGRHRRGLKLINVPVLKHHDVGGSEITGALKHCYGLLSMADGHVAERHYAGLGQTCAEMFASVRAPVLNVMDATWVSHASLGGYPPQTTTRVNQIMASQDPVALDYLAAKEILYPIDGNPRHHPDFPGIRQWLTAARDRINELGGLSDPEGCLSQRQVTLDESLMRVHGASL